MGDDELITGSETALGRSVGPALQAKAVDLEELADVLVRSGEGGMLDVETGRVPRSPIRLLGDRLATRR